MGRRHQVSPSFLVGSAVILSLAWPQVDVVFAQQGSDQITVSPHPTGKYVGLTKCAACHFDQFKDWKGSEHNRAFEILPLKYRNDASCLKCHTTDVTDAPSQLFGVSCESCHGPGDEHAKYALQFVDELITEEGLISLRGKIRRLDMMACVKCHISKAHKKHPPYDRDETPRLPVNQSSPSKSFFENIHTPQPTLGPPLQR